MNTVANFLSIAALALTFTGQAAFAKNYKKTLLANTGDFVILSNIEQSTVNIFLSGAGHFYNHCGLKIQTGNTIAGKELSEVISIKNANSDGDNEVGVLEENRLVTIESPKQTSFGTMYQISTRLGESLKSVIENAATSIDEGQAIVEIRPCTK